MIDFFKFALESWTNFFGVIVLVWVLGLSIAVALSTFKPILFKSKESSTDKKSVTITDDASFISVTFPNNVVCSFKLRSDQSGYDRI